MPLPELIQVEQRFPDHGIDNVSQVVREELSRVDLRKRIRPNARIAITAGSRGIANIAEIIRTIVDFVVEAGGRPFILPAMGSHGGATPDGQRAVLEGVGITSKTVGAPIECDTESTQIGHAEGGLPVFVNRLALEADGVLVVNRIKPHTSFRGRFESGLMKMMTIGLGGHRGATLAHSHGIESVATFVPTCGRVVLDRVPILMGLAILEDAHEQTSRLVALRPEEIEARESELLKEASRNMARLLVRDIDVLIVREIGKDISGTCMDPNVIGRLMLAGTPEPKEPGVSRIVALSLTPGSHGNANGVGLADIITRRLHDQIDPQTTYTNAFTSTVLHRAFIPVVMETDRAAIEAALRVCHLSDPNRARVVAIKNTLDLRHIFVGKAMLSDVRDHDQLEPKTEPMPMTFDSNEHFYPEC